MSAADCERCGHVRYQHHVGRKHCGVGSCTCDMFVEPRGMEQLRARVAELEKRRSFWKWVARRLRLHKYNYRLNYQHGREDDRRWQEELRRERDEARAGWNAERGLREGFELSLNEARAEVAERDRRIGELEAARGSAVVALTEVTVERRLGLEAFAMCREQRDAFEDERDAAIQRAERAEAEVERLRGELGAK